MRKKYLLLGWKPKPRLRTRQFTNCPDPGRMPGRLIPLASGNAKTVIREAAESDCGVLLFDTVPK